MEALDVWAQSVSSILMKIGSTVGSLIAGKVWVGRRIDLEKELVVRRFKN